MKPKMNIACLALGTLLAMPRAYACPPALLPDTADLSQYQSIFIGLVATVRQMPQSEWRTLCVKGHHRATFCRSKHVGLPISPMYEISILPRTSIVDAPLGVKTMQLPACGDQIPRVQGYGIFFIPKDADQPIVSVYASDPLSYSNLLLKLGALKPESSDWDKLQK